jgi:hypothetical protein
VCLEWPCFPLPLEHRGPATNSQTNAADDNQFRFSLGEASARIQATDLERRKTPPVGTAPPGLRVEPKWLSAPNSRIRRVVPKL